MTPDDEVAQLATPGLEAIVRKMLVANGLTKECLPDLEARLATYRAAGDLVDLMMRLACMVHAMADAGFVYDGIDNDVEAVLAVIKRHPMGAGALKLLDPSPSTMH